MFCSNKRCSPRSIFLFVAVLLAALWLIWFGAASLLGKKEVEHGLQQLSLQLSDLGKEYGKDIKITYGEITIEGWGYNKQAVVNNVEIELTTPMSPEKYKLSTGNMVVSSDPLDYRRLLMKISEPVVFTQNEIATNSIVFSEPLFYAYREVDSGNTKTMQSDIFIPKQISLLSGQATSETKPGDQATVISFTKNPTIQIISVPDQKKSSLAYTIPGITLSNLGQNIVTIGEVLSNVNKTSGDAEGRIVGKNLFTAKDIVFYINQTPTKPYSVNLDADIVVDHNPQTDETAKTGEAATNLSAADSREVIINDYTMSDPDFKLTVTGKFSNADGDQLPSGQLNIDIDSLPNFMSSELVTNLRFGNMENALVKITGAPLAGQTQVSIPVKREKNGTLYIGKTTFEELVASMFSASMMPTPPIGERLPETDMPYSHPSVDEPKVDLPISQPNQ